MVVYTQVGILGCTTVGIPGCERRDVHNGVPQGVREGCAQRCTSGCERRENVHTGVPQGVRVNVSNVLSPCSPWLFPFHCWMFLAQQYSLWRVYRSFRTVSRFTVGFIPAPSSRSLLDTALTRFTVGHTPSQGRLNVIKWLISDS